MEDTNKKLHMLSPVKKDPEAEAQDSAMPEAALDEVSGGTKLINRPPHYPPPYNPFPINKPTI